MKRLFPCYLTSLHLFPSPWFCSLAVCIVRGKLTSLLAPPSSRASATWTLSAKCKGDSPSFRAHANTIRARTVRRRKIKACQV